MKSRSAILLVVLAACGGTAEVGDPGPPPVASAPSAAACSGPGADTDRDGLTDRCETALAAFFAPVLVAAPDRCREGDGEEDGEGDGLPAGGYFHGAQPVGEAVRLVYLPAYFVDCGWSGPKCLLPGVDCSPHAGDSELLAVEVVPGDAGGWRVEAVFLSAHCFGRAGGACRWYRRDELERFDWAGRAAGSSPIVWVSEGRHAGYPSRAACDRGHYLVDTCDRNTVTARFPVGSGRDIGSEAVPVQSRGAPPGCVRGAEVGSPPAVVPDVVECFWTERPFRGWQKEGGDGGATAYLRYLEEVAGF